MEAKGQLTQVPPARGQFFLASGSGRRSGSPGPVSGTTLSHNLFAPQCHFIPLNYRSWATSAHFRVRIMPNCCTSRCLGHCLGESLRKVWGCLGRPGRAWGSLGRPGEGLGGAWGCLGEPGEDLGKPGEGLGEPGGAWGRLTSKQIVRHQERCDMGGGASQRRL